MEALVALLGLGATIVCGLYLWTFTKSGKKWLESL